MAQVKVQTSAPPAGPGLSPGVSPTAIASQGSLGLQPSVNGTGPAPTPACPAPAVGYGDAPVSATSPGRMPTRCCDILVLRVPKVVDFSLYRISIYVY